MALKINATEHKPEPQPPAPEGFHLTATGLPKPGSSAAETLALYAIYEARTVRYQPVALADGGKLDLWIPRVEPGEVLFRLVDEKDPDEPKAIATGKG